MSQQPAPPATPATRTTRLLACGRASTNPGAVHARLRALLCLANHYPDTTAAIYQAQAGRLPLNPVDHTPTRRRALAWANTLDRLGRRHPDDFESRYRPS
jgi:hypothetical protein